MLFNLATEYLMAAKTIQPGATTLAKMVATARTSATALTWEKVAHLLTDERRRDLDQLLKYDAGLKMTRLAWLIKAPPTPARPRSRRPFEKLTYLRNMDAHTLDMSHDLTDGPLSRPTLRCGGFLRVWRSCGLMLPGSGLAGSAGRGLVRERLRW
ncbi:hypothetical protein OHA25_38175 [Nonomuraea sp. NBC_00507]|uniref:hypothetical protein n=1 Tax=Nonomuraea sp. NBC_00507 TaxID=2976002 RepID=UPI002E18DA92